MSCGYRGDAVDLARTVLGLVSRGVAKDWVEKHAAEEGAPLPTTVREEILPVISPGFKLPPGVRPLRPHEDEQAGRALAYLERRRISAKQIERWQIGYAVDGRLSGRVVFPACGRDGRLLSYTARSYLDDPVRYLMPKAEEGADSGAIFGERWWPKPSERRALFLSEGAINALAVERQLGESPPGVGVGAVGGSELAVEQLLKIGAWPRVVLVRDGDGAGRKLQRAIKGALARMGEFRWIPMPAGEDAADLEARDPEAFRALLEKALGAG